MCLIFVEANQIVLNIVENKFTCQIDVNMLSLRFTYFYRTAAFTLVDSSFTIQFSMCIVCDEMVFNEKLT